VALMAVGLTRAILENPFFIRMTPVRAQGRRGLARERAASGPRRGDARRAGAGRRRAQDDLLAVLALSPVGGASLRPIHVVAMHRLDPCRGRSASRNRPAPFHSMRSEVHRMKRRAMFDRSWTRVVSAAAGLAVALASASLVQARSHPGGRVGVPAMVARVLPAVVSITTCQIEPDQFNQPVPTRGLGSGFRCRPPRLHPDQQPRRCPRRPRRRLREPCRGHTGVLPAPGPGDGAPWPRIL
jgi:hypothetical protein